MLRCYYATLAYVRTPLKNRKYITYKYISIYVGELGCFLSVVCNVCGTHRSRHPRPENEAKKTPQICVLRGCFRSVVCLDV